MNTVFANTRLNFPQVKRLTNCGLSDIFINIGFNFFNFFQVKRLTWQGLTGLIWKNIFIFPFLFIAINAGANPLYYVNHWHHFWKR